MAKESGENYDFVPPDFDEDAFIHREMVAFKTTSILFGWAIVAAAVSWGAFVALKGDDAQAWPAGLAICLVFGLLLKPIFARTADIAHFKRSNWIGTGFLFFFCWLAFFVVAMNPPVSDFSPPQVMVSADPPVQAAGGEVIVTFLASDNDRLAAKPELTVRRDGDPVETPPFEESGSGRYIVPLANPTTQPGTYSVLVTATDARGHTSQATANFTVQGGDLVQVRLPPGGNLTGTEQVLVTVDAKSCTVAPTPCLRTVYFSPGAQGDPVPLEYNEGLGGWFATARFEGWKEGENTGRVVAEFMDHYQGTSHVRGGRFESGPVTLRVAPAGGDLHEVEVPPQASPEPVIVPGYGALGTLAAVAGVAFLLRRRVAGT